jgi:hypothetical protein
MPTDGRELGMQSHHLTKSHISNWVALLARADEVIE